MSSYINQPIKVTSNSILAILLLELFILSKFLIILIQKILNTDHCLFFFKFYFSSHVDPDLLLPSLKPCCKVTTKCSFSFCFAYLTCLSFVLLRFSNAVYRHLSSIKFYFFNFQQNFQYLLSRLQPVWYQSFFLKFISIVSLQLVLPNTLS